MGEELEPIDNPSPRLEFRQPFDGTQLGLSAEEKELAAQKFSALMDDTFLRYAQYVEHFESGEYKNSLLILNLPLEEGFWKIEVEAEPESSIRAYQKPELPDFISNVYSKKISLIFIEAGTPPRAREAVDYYVSSEDGIVRRGDEGDLWGKKFEVQPEDVYLESFDDTEIDLVEKIWDDLRYAVERKQFLEAVGINYSPVSTHEIEGLAAMLSSPDLQPVAR